MSQESIASLEATLEAAHDAIIVLDKDFHIVRYNGHFLTLFGVTADTMNRGIDALAEEILPQLENAEAVSETGREMFRNLGAEMSTQLRFKDGRVYEMFGAPYRLDDAIPGRVLSLRDISRFVRTEEALEHHRAFLEKAQEVAHIGSWVAELDAGQSLGWSVEAHRIFGVPIGEFEGTSLAFFARVHPADRDAVLTASLAAQAGERPYDIEHRIIRPDGTIRWVHEKADIVRDAQGKGVRMIGTVQDITDRRLLEDQLRQSQKMEAIGRLAGGIAHDLNNALTAIAGYAELAIGQLDPQHSARGDVEEIRRAAERAGSVTRQLLAFSRKEILEPRLFDLNETITALGRLLGRLLGATVQVSTDLAAPVPAILGDPGQVEQAVINLAVNARDAMPDGGRLVLSTTVENVDETTARMNPPMAPGRYIVLRVTDTGIGMTPEVQARIFEPFFTTKETGKGTGLGLSMVYGTLKQIGGFIFVDSERGRGTTFRLYFRPAAPSLAARSAPRVEESAHSGHETVLVVEDEQAVRNLVASALRSEGYRLLLAGSAEEALDVASAHGERIDLLLTDAIMPGKSGIELSNLLVAERPGLRVIIMSGYTEETLSGLSDRVELLQKPFAPRELRRRVREALDQVREKSR